MKKFTVGSLFAGIGGFDLGFERAGFKTSWQVEIDPYCLKVLAKNFPEAERFGDIRECCGVPHKFTGEDGKPLCDMRNHLKPVDVICGGFPCQDISNAGKRAGIEGERSGLWSEMHRIIRELRPPLALIENVAALVGFGLERVLCDLAASGFNAEWDVVSAASVGAPHLRRRLWILAYPGGEGIYQRGRDCSVGEESEPTRRAKGYELPRQQQVPCEVLANSKGERCREGGRVRHNEPTQRTSRRGQDVSHADSQGLQIARHAGKLSETPIGIYTRPTVDGGYRWAIEPNVGRVAHGVPKRVDRLRGLGNAVVPQIPEMIARRIKQALEATR